MKKRQKAYFGLSWVISIILAIFPLSNIIFGIIIRVQRKKIVSAIFNFLISPIFYILDLVSILAYKDLTFFA